MRMTPLSFCIGLSLIYRCPRTIESIETLDILDILDVLDVLCICSICSIYDFLSLCSYTCRYLSDGLEGEFM